ncbi:protein DOWNY MILDEW RESISTANCE 6-like [Cornus florida]|uniref:protein DOWNY MILDEW RESISTANCE 6-like n=1 Tax=Cornus florida TaxID=4283 RepID=UPI002897FE23|nr:protein DOWNY MILDEW RESISTANCE 6-like [Cornus florida]
MSSQVLATIETTPPAHELRSNGDYKKEIAAYESDDYKKGVKYLTDMLPNLLTLPSQYVLPFTTSPLSVSHASIPVIDLSGLNGSSESRITTIQAIDSACVEWGIFRVVNHGIKISLMEEMLEAVVGFFNLSLEEKMKYASDDPKNPPVKYGTSVNASMKQAMWRDYLRHHGRPLHTSFHLWPNTPSNYKNIAKEFVEEVWQLQLKIASALSESLGLDSDYIEKSLGEGFQVVGANYYPPCPEPHRTLAIPPHSDHGGLTVLMQNDVDGLQVQHKEEWVAVGHVPGTFVVNVGDYLEILSNGRYKTLKHRGVTDKQRTRISIAVGNGPGLMTKVAPASPLMDGESEIKYGDVTYKEFMELHQNGAIGKNPLQAMIDLQVNK